MKTINGFVVQSTHSALTTDDRKYHKYNKKFVLILPQDYYSTAKASPPKDAVQNYEIITASESGVQTVVEFSRDADTGDNAKDVQFMVSK